MTTVQVRREGPQDIHAIGIVNVSAFGGDVEAQIVDRLRERGKLLVSLVAESGGAIVGHIAFSAVTIGASAEVRGVGLAPTAVSPSMQRRGIGGLLVEEGLRRCRDLGYGFAVVLGHPTYYPRFGFVPASRFRLRCAWDLPDEAFMARELRAGALKSIWGLVSYEPEFDVAI